MEQDQTWLDGYFRTRGGWVRLDESVWNARPFVHPRRLGVRKGKPMPRIWHWHGYKPADVACWHRAMRDGRWPWEKPTCKGRGRCIYRPIKASGCRYVGSIKAGGCYLRTYAYLLTQHENLVRMARGNVSTGGLCELSQLAPPSQVARCCRGGR